MSSGSRSDDEKAGEAPTTTSPPGEGEAPPGAGNPDIRLVPTKPRLRARYHYAAYIVIALFLVWWDPFHWNEASSNVSQDLAYRVLIGPLYPTEQRDRITVVLFNEATLEHLGATWPVALGKHAEILRSIRAMGPSAVMVDFIFPDERDDPSVARLHAEIEEYKKAKIPLYFARAEGAGLNWIRPDLYPAATLTSVANPISDGVSRTYELCSTLPGDSPVCACVLGFNEFAACPADAGATPLESPAAVTAAFDMFRAVEDRLPEAFSIHHPQPMEVVWSNRVNPENQKWMVKQTKDGFEDLCRPIGSGLGDWWRRLNSAELSFRQTCPYATTMAAHNLLKADEDPKLRNELWIHLQRKFVFYGGDLAGLEDTVVPPTHVKLPGVYLHAMALDNLLTFGGRYKHSSISIFGSDIGAGNLTYLLATLLAVIVVFFARWEPVVQADRIAANMERGFAYFGILWRRWRFWFLFNLGMFLVIVAVCLVLYEGLGISPKNWLGYWGLMTALSAMAKGRLAEGVATTISEHFVPPLGPVFFKEERT